MGLSPAHTQPDTPGRAQEGWLCLFPALGCCLSTCKHQQPHSQSPWGLGLLPGCWGGTEMFLPKPPFLCLVSHAWLQCSLGYVIPCTDFLIPTRLCYSDPAFNMAVPALLTSMSSTQMAGTSSSPGLVFPTLHGPGHGQKPLKSFICLLRSLTIHGRAKISRKAEIPAGVWPMDAPNLVSLASAITARSGGFCRGEHAAFLVLGFAV